MAQVQESSATSSVAGVVILSSGNGRRGRAGKEKGAASLESALKSEGLAVRRIRLAAGDGGRPRLKHAARAVKASIDELLVRNDELRDRVGVIAEGRAAESAVLGSRVTGQVRPLVLLSGRLSRRAKEVLAEWDGNPVLCIASSEDRASLRDMADVYFQSEHPDTDIRVLEGMGRGARMIRAWSEACPNADPLERVVARWLRRQLCSFGREREVSFMTQDGWKIFGNLSVPDTSLGRSAGIVLLHSGRSDRYVFARLERLLVRAGFSVLNIDWRGRGMSVNKGRYLDLSKEDRANGKIDARAAIDFLASQAGVDSQRIGLVGVIHGAEHGVRASIDDSRVKAISVLTGYMPATDDERAYLISGKVAVMYVTCRGHREVTESVRQLYEASQSKLTRLLIYNGGAIGYQLFELDERLEPFVVDWLAEALVPGRSIGSQQTASGGM